MNVTRLVRRIAMSCGVVLVTGWLMACNNQAADEPTRPAGVPAEAKFVGGVDGGIFLSLRARNASEYAIVVYLDSGSLAYRGPAKPDPPSSRVLTIEDVDGWDGERLILTSGGTLAPTQPMQPLVNF